MEKIKNSIFLDIMFFIGQVTFVLAVIFGLYLVFEKIYTIFF